MVWSVVVGLAPPSPDWKPGAALSLLTTHLGYGLDKYFKFLRNSLSRGITYLYFPGFSLKLSVLILFLSNLL